MRVQILKDYVKQHFPATPLLDYALEVEKITTSKVKCASIYFVSSAFSYWGRSDQWLMLYFNCKAQYIVAGFLFFYGRLWAKYKCTLVRLKMFVGHQENAEQAETHYLSCPQYVWNCYIL